MEGRSPGSDGPDGAGLGLGIQSAGRGSYPPVPGVSDDTRDTTYGSDGTALHTRWGALRGQSSSLPLEGLQIIGWPSTSVDSLQTRRTEFKGNLSHHRWRRTRNSFAARATTGLIIGLASRLCSAILSRIQLLATHLSAVSSEPWTPLAASLSSPLSPPSPDLVGAGAIFAAKTPKASLVPLPRKDLPRTLTTVHIAWWHRWAVVSRSGLWPSVSAAPESAQTTPTAVQRFGISKRKRRLLLSTPYHARIYRGL